MSIFLKKKQAYFVASLFLLILGVVYEYFSHGVYSIYMIGAFMIPIGFVILSKISEQLFRVRLINKTAYQLLCFTAVLASLTQGVIVIYGTTNSLVEGYLGFAVVLCLALGLEIKHQKKRQANRFKVI